MSYKAQKKGNYAAQLLRRAGFGKSKGCRKGNSFEDKLARNAFNKRSSQSRVQDLARLASAASKSADGLEVVIEGKNKWITLIQNAAKQT